LDKINAEGTPPAFTKPYKKARPLPRLNMAIVRL